MKKEVQQTHFKPRLLVSEVSDGSGEGFYEDAKALSMADFGSIFVKISEFGLFLKNTNNYRSNFLATLYDAYDGKVYSKSIKTDERQPNLEEIPVNLLAYSDFTLFKTEIKQYFRILMQTGLARRCMVSFQRPTKLIFKPKTDCEERAIYEKAKELGNRLFAIFQAIKPYCCYKLSPEAKNFHNDFEAKLTDDFNDEKNELLQSSIKSGGLKALKLSNLYACLNHPSELNINVTDINQATKTIEFLSDSIKDFLRYKPKTDDIYDKVFEFFKENLNKEFKKSKLIGEYYTEIGLARDTFRKNFDEIIETVSEIAVQSGYLLTIDTEKYRNGYAFKLIENQPDQLSDEVQDLKNLLSG